MTREMKQTIRNYLMLQGTIAFGIQFTTAFYVTFLMAKGLNYLEVNLVNVFFWATLFICELPTGAFADVYGRKISFVLSCLLFGAGMIVYGFSETFWGFVGAEVVIAVGQTFSSGAFNAWLVDRLHQQGYQGSFAKIFARKQQVGQVVGIFSAILGAFLGSYNLSLPWLIGGAVMVVAAGLAFGLMEEDRGERKLSFLADMKQMQDIAVSSIKYSVKHAAVRFILIVGAFQWFAVQAPNMYWQPLFQPFISSAAELGFVKAFISVCIMIGAAMGPWFLRRVGNERRAIVIVEAGIGLGIVGTVLFPQFAVIFSIFMAHEVIRGMVDPIKESYLHDNIPRQKRATIASCDSMSMRLGGVIGLLLSGVIAQYVSLSMSWIVSGLVLTASAVLLWRNGHAK